MKSFFLSLVALRRSIAAPSARPVQLSQDQLRQAGGAGPGGQWKTSTKSSLMGPGGQW